MGTSVKLQKATMGWNHDAYLPSVVRGAHDLPGMIEAEAEPMVSRPLGHPPRECGLVVDPHFSQ